MHEGLGFLSTFLLVFAAIGLVVACFTIYNTFQIIVTQRSREMALLRSVGATRRQVLWAQLHRSGHPRRDRVGHRTVRRRGRGRRPEGDDGRVRDRHPRRRHRLLGSHGASSAMASARSSPSRRRCSRRCAPRACHRWPRSATIAADAGGQPRAPRLIQGGVVTAARDRQRSSPASAASGILMVGIGALLVFLGVFTLGPLDRPPGRPIARRAGRHGAAASPG